MTQELDPPRRRLVVLLVDLAESTRLMELHERDVIRRWRSFTHEVQTQLLPGCHGRLVNVRADGLLAAFDDVPHGIEAAFALHAAIGRINQGCLPDATMLLRIGIHQGEASDTGDDLIGADVNLTARIAGLGAPGATTLSAAACAALRDGVHAHLEDLGDRFLKHVNEAVRVFRATPLPSLSAVARAGARGEGGAGRLLPDKDLKPTLAVIPFVAIPADDLHDALGHAIADDIIAGVSRHPNLRVVSRLSTSAFRDRSLDWTQLRGLLGATYVLSGRYYPMGERLRVSLELAATADGEVLWADSLRTEVAALFEGQGELVTQVVGRIGHVIAAHELARVRSLPMNSLQSYALYLGAEGLMGSLVQKDFRRAREVLEHLAERHPRQPEPRAMLAHWYVNNIVQAWSADVPADARRGREQALRALDIDGDHPASLSAEGLARLNLLEDVDGAGQWLNKAMQADPQDAATWSMLSAVHGYRYELDQACEAAERALALSPLDPKRFLFEAYAAMAKLAAGRYAEAVAHARHSARLHALHKPSHLLLVGSLWLAGQQAQAREAASRYLQLFPGANSGSRTASGREAQADWRDRLADAVRSAGVPAAPTH